MIKSFTLNNTSDSILSRICLVSLIWLLLILGGFSSRAWGATSSVNTANLWEASTDDANDRVVWTAPNVTFRLHNNGDGGNIELYLNDHILIQKNKTYKLEWEVADGYTIEVRRVSVRARSTLKSYITVGSTTSGNIYGQSYTTVTSEALSLGNDGYVTIRPNQGADGRDDAIVHMDGITVTYTFAGLTYTVNFNGNGSTGGSTSSQSFSFDEAKNLTTNGFTRTNYKFLGWTTNSDGSGTFYKDGENVVNLSSTNGAIVNLYAKWTNEQTVTFNDGTFSKKVGNVTFYLENDGDKHFQWYSRDKYYWIKESNDSKIYLAKIYWDVNEGYTIAVSKLNFIADGGGLTTNSKGYLSSASYLYPNVMKFYESKDKKNIEISSTSYSPLYPTGSSSMGNNDYFQFKNTSKYIQYNDIKLTYTITPNEHTITLDDNSGHGGDGTHKVTYDAATGSLTNAPTLYGYNFTGYYTSGGTQIFNADKSVVSGVSTYTDGSGNWIKDDDVELSAHWTANNYTITLRNQSATTAGTTSLAVTFDANTNLTSSITIPAKTDHIFDGYYTGENGTGIKIIEADGSIIASAGDDTYTDGSKNWKYAGDIILYAKWTSKQTPRFTPDGFSNESTNAIYVGDILSLNVADVSDGLAGDFTATYDNTYFNVAREGNTISIEALNAGDGKTVVFTQTENSSIFAATETYTFNVSKVANTMTIKDDCEKYVGQELTDVIGNINSNGTITTTSSAAGIAHYDIANDKIVVDNASAVQFGASQDVTIIINQEATYKYTAASETIVVTVKKYPNAITCSWGEWSKNVNFDSETAVTFSSNNDTGTPIVVTQSPASSVATYDGTNNKIVANYRMGDVTWEVSQVEDYKYQAATTKTLSVNVGTIRGYDVCYVLEDRTENSFETAGESKEFTFSIDQPGDTIYFDAKYEEICVIGICVGSTSAWALNYKVSGGGSYQHLKDENNNDVYINCPSKDTYYSFKYAIPENARKFQFDGEAGAVGKKFVKNVRVSRKRWLKLENAGSSVISELDMPINTRGGNVTRNTFYINYSTCADRIKLVSNNDHVKFAANNSTTYEFDVENGTRKAIELTYTSPADAEDIAATITVYTPYEHKTLTVNAETKGKLSTTIEYKGADSYAVDHANMSATDLFQVRDENGDLLASPAITLETSDGSKIAIVGGNAVDFRCGGGSATITASYAGDATYAAASDLGQTITVNKLSDAISWSSVGDDGKIHVLADTDIPTSIASANTDIASYSVASANPYLSVTEEEGVYTLHAGIVGEVALTATSAGDCTYATASGSKTIAVDPREHAIIWDQDLEGIQTDDRGYIINRRITLNAYAVDNGSNPTNVPVSYEITGGGTFATIENGNELVINVANLSGTLSTTITATTTVGTKYAIVSETKTISVVRWGTNTAKSADNTSDIKDGKIVISAPHATFTFSGATAITEFGYATVGGKPEGYKLAQALDNGDGSKTYNFSWVSTNANCSIQVNKISFWIKAYDSDAFIWQRAKVSFDGADEVSVGTAAMTANDGDFAKFSKPENYTNRNVPVVCRVTGSENFDFYIKNISIEYTVYTTAPSATGDIEQVDRTINTSDKQTVDVRDLFSYAVAPPSDFEYSYEIVGAPEHAFLEGGYMFWADAVGDYTVRAKVNMEEDHRESEWSDEKTIRVNKVPYVFNNTAADEKWETATNWNIGGWPIENLPTEDDDVIVRGHLIVDEEIPVHSLTIGDEVGHIVEIAPEGGLTVGAGGISGATKDKLILRADKGAAKSARKGQTGYLRISPEYTGAMPELTTELYSIGYYDKSKPDDDIAAWQYVGSPIDFEGKLAKTVFTRSWIYSYVESTNSWVNNRSTLVMQPFTGYKTTQYDDKDGKLLSFKGKLIPNNCLYTIDLAYTDEDHGHNLVANSFAAPISIAQFRDTDFVNAEKTIYIYNTGSRKQYLAKGAVANSAGQYTPIAIRTAAEMEEFFGDNPDISSTIAPMQGFFVNATGADAKLKFNYSKLVWNVASVDNQPLRAPKRAANTDITAALKITLEADSLTDNVYMLESEGYELEYEDGYDAHKLHGGKFNVFTIRNDEQLAIDATNSIIGTRVGVRTGEETAYTLEFSHLTSENGLALYDSETEQTIDINEGTQYTFFAESNAMITERFEIVARADAPAITTGVDKVENGAKVHKFIKDNQLFILKNGVLYNATGAVVR